MNEPQKCRGLLEWECARDRQNKHNRAGYFLDKSPAGPTLMSNAGFSILRKDTSTCSSALPGARI